MARQGHRVHQDAGRVGQLNQRDLVGGNISQWRQGIFADTDVIAVQDNAEIGPVRPAHNLPCLHPVPDMAAPRQGFISD